MTAVRLTASDISESMESLKEIVNLGIEENNTARRLMELDLEINQLTDEAESMMRALTHNLEQEFDEDHFVDLRTRLAGLEEERKNLLYSGGNIVMTKERLEQIDDTLELLLHQAQSFDDILIRQLITKLTVLSKTLIKIDFIGGKTVEQEIRL